MNPGRRAAAGEYVQRVNRAARLLRQVGSLGEVIAKVARLYAISPRQARRYVEAAQQMRGPLPLPEAKVVLTVKVPASLPMRVRQRAHAEGRSLSDLVTRALDAYLRRRPPGPRGHPPED
jgi:transposase-like protein